MHKWLKAIKKNAYEYHDNIHSRDIKIMEENSPNNQSLDDDRATLVR